LGHDGTAKGRSGCLNERQSSAGVQQLCRGFARQQRYGIVGAVLP
jgi:hypothetical protein